MKKRRTFSVAMRCAWYWSKATHKRKQRVVLALVAQRSAARCRILMLVAITPFLSMATYYHPR